GRWFATHSICDTCQVAPQAPANSRAFGESAFQLSDLCGLIHLFTKTSRTALAGSSMLLPSIMLSESERGTSEDESKHPEDASCNHADSSHSPHAPVTNLPSRTPRELKMPWYVGKSTRDSLELKICKGCSGTKSVRRKPSISSAPLCFKGSQLVSFTSAPECPFHP